jgi:hypothetical protein
MSPLPRQPPGPHRGAGRSWLGRNRPLQGSLLAAAALVACMLFGLAAYGSVIRPGGLAGPVAAAPPVPGPEKVRLAGHAAGLYPGSVRRFRVRVENGYIQPVTVHSIEALVQSASRRCAAANVRVSSFHGALRIPPQRRRWVLLTIAMRRDAANACQHARFPISYRARVTR